MHEYRTPKKRDGEASVNYTRKQSPECRYAHVAAFQRGEGVRCGRFTSGGASGIVYPDCALLPEGTRDDA